MFGRQYWRYPDVLSQSYRTMHRDQKINLFKNKSWPVRFLIKLYILLFGIPEIGFQVRSNSFNHLLKTQLRHKKLSNILDAGSGIGSYTLLLGETFPEAHVTGCDIDLNKLRVSQRLANDLHRKNITFTKIDITKMPAKKTYDLIITIDVLEHVNNYDRALINFHSRLTKGGCLYIHVPLPNQIRLLPQLQGWRHDDHIHDGIDKYILKKQLQRIGFRVIAMKETFGFFGKLAWELNHIMLTKHLILAAITFPLLYMMSLFDELQNNKKGLCVSILAQKN